MKTTGIWAIALLVSVASSLSFDEAPSKMQVISEVSIPSVPPDCSEGSCAVEDDDASLIQIKRTSIPHLYHELAPVKFCREFEYRDKQKRKVELVPGVPGESSPKARIHGEKEDKYQEVHHHVEEVDSEHNMEGFGHVVSGITTECASYRTLTVSPECVKSLSRVSEVSQEAGLTIFQKKWSEELLKAIKQGAQNERSKYEQWYTSGSEPLGVGYVNFNCFLRSSPHLGFVGGYNDEGKSGQIPSGIYSVAQGLSAELSSHTGASNWPESSTELTYRGSFCLELYKGAPVFIASFLSTSLEPLTNYIFETSCVYGFKDFHSAFPSSPRYANEAEVLIPRGLCFDVVAKLHRDPEGKKSVFDANVPSQKKAIDLLRQRKYKTEFLLKGRPCGDDWQDYPIM